MMKGMTTTLLAALIAVTPLAAADDPEENSATGICGRQDYDHSSSPNSIEVLDIRIPMLVSYEGGVGLVGQITVRDPDSPLNPLGPGDSDSYAYCTLPIDAVNCALNPGTCQSQASPEESGDDGSADSGHTGDSPP